MAEDIIQIGTLKFPVQMTHFSVHEKQYTQEIIGLRGNNTNLPSGKNMIYTDFRFIFTGQSNVTEKDEVMSDVEALRRLIAQLRATPFFPVKSPILSALVRQISPPEYGVELSKESKEKGLELIKGTLSNTGNNIKTKISKIKKEINSAIEVLLRSKEGRPYRDRYPTQAISSSKFVDEYFKKFELLFNKPEETEKPIKSIDTNVEKLISTVTNELITKISDSIEFDKSNIIDKRFKKIFEFTLKSSARELNLANTVFDLFTQNEIIAQRNLLKKAKTEEELLPGDFGSYDSEQDDNVHLAISNLEWFSHPEVKTGFIVKLTALYFNHDPYSSQIRYIKTPKVSTFDLADCNLFKSYYNRYLLTEKDSTIPTSSSDLKNSDEYRSWNKGKFFDVNKPLTPTKFVYNMFDWIVDETKVVSGKDQKTIEEGRNRGLDFEKTFKRDYSKKNIKVVEGFDQSNNTFTKQVQCSLTWPLAIIPLQGSRHSTVQFYGKPVGKCSMTLHFEKMDEDIEGPNHPKAIYNRLRDASEDVRAKFNNSLKKYLRYNPFLIDNQLINLGGLYYFNLEDMTSTTLEESKSSIDVELTMFEQHVPSLEREKNTNNLIDYNLDSKVSSIKLTTVLKFLADKDLEESFDKADRGDLLKKRTEILSRLSSEVLDTNVWFTYFIKQLVPPMYGLGKEVSDYITFDPRDVDIKKIEDTILSTVREVRADKITEIEYDDFVASNKELLSYLENFDVIEDKLVDAAKVSDILATLGLYKDVPQELTDIPFSDSNEVYPTWSILKDKIDKRNVNWSNAESSVARSLLLNSVNPLDLYGEGSSIPNFIATFFNDLTFSIFRAGFKFNKNEDSNLKEWSTSEGSLPVKQAAEALELSIEDQKRLMNLSSVPELILKYREIKENLVNQSNISPDVDSKKFFKEFMETLNKVKNQDISDWEYIAFAVALTSIPKAARGTALGLGVANPSIIAKVLGSAEEIAKAGSEIKPGKLAALKSIIKTASKAGIKIIGTLILNVSNPVGSLAKSGSFVYANRFVSPETVKKLRSGAKFQRILNIVGGKTVGILGLGLTLLLVRNQLKKNDEAADMINLMLSDYVGSYFRGILNLVILHGYIPNQKTIEDLNRYVNTIEGEDQRIALDEIYNEVTSLGYTTESNTKKKKISAYPDFNLPTYRDLIDTTFSPDESRALDKIIVNILSDVQSLEDLVTTFSTEGRGLTSFVSKSEKLKNSLNEVKDSAKSLKASEIPTFIKSARSNLKVKFSSLSISLGPLLTVISTSPKIKIANLHSVIHSRIEKLITDTKSITPELLKYIMPTYQELGIEPKYNPDPKSKPEFELARELDDFVDPTFYIERDHINPFYMMEQDGQTFGSAPATKTYINENGVDTALKVQSNSVGANAYLKGVNHSKEDPSLGDPDKGVPTQNPSLVPITRTKYSKEGKYESESFNPSYSEEINSELEKGFRNKYLFNVSALGRFNKGLENHMNKAFPTFSVFFIKENRNIMTERHLIADFYLYQNIMDINICRDKITGSVATVTLSNVFGTFDNDTFRQEIRDPKKGEIIKENDIAKKFRYSNFRLREGTLIQIKQGYSPNFEELENVFTGKISEVQAGDVITIICQGHEHELMNRTREDLDIGITTGQNYYDYTAQIMRDTKHFGQPFSSSETKDLIRHKRAHSKELYSSRDSFKPSTFFSSLLTSHFDASRATENVWIGNEARAFVDWFMFNDFKIRDESKLEALHEISRYHHSNVCFPLPYDSRATLFMGPPSHPYKYTSFRDESLVRFEQDVNKISPYLKDVANSSLFDLEKFDFIKIFLDRIKSSGKGSAAMDQEFIIGRSVVSYKEKKKELIDKIIEGISLLRAASGDVDFTRPLDAVLQGVSGVGELFGSVLDSLDIDNASLNEYRAGTTKESASTAVNVLRFDLFKHALPLPPSIERMMNLYTQSRTDWYKAVLWDINPPQLDPKLTVRIDLINGADSLSKIPVAVKILIVKDFLKKFNDKNFPVHVAKRGTFKGSNLQANEDLVDDIDKFIIFNDSTISSHFYDALNRAKSGDTAVKFVRPDLDGTYLRLVRGLETSYSTSALSDLIGKFLPKNRDNSDFIINFKIYYFLIAGLFARFTNESNTELAKELKYRALSDKTITEVSENMKHLPGYKPFRNHHVITSRDIVRNEIQCTIAEMANEVHVLTPNPNTDFAKKGWEAVTGLLGFDADNNDSYWRSQISSFCVFQAPSEKIIRRIVEPNAYTLTQQINISMRDLAEAMKPMYRGQLILIGRKDIKPYDVIHLRDSYNNVHGVIEVEKVVHTHTLKDGWVTTIHPHLVNHYGQVQENHLVTAISSAFSVLEAYLTVTGIAGIGRGVVSSLGLKSLGKGTFGELKKLHQEKGYSMLVPPLLSSFNKGMSTWLQVQFPQLMNDLLRSDVALSGLLDPQFTTFGRGTIPGIAPDTSYLRPVVLSPLTKDNQPWVAGLKGTREYDSFASLGIMGQFLTANIEAFQKGIIQYTDTSSVFVTTITEDFNRISRNLSLLGRRF